MLFAPRLRELNPFPVRAPECPTERATYILRQMSPDLDTIYNRYPIIPADKYGFNTDLDKLERSEKKGKYFSKHDSVITAQTSLSTVLRLTTGPWIPDSDCARKAKKLTTFSVFWSTIQSNRKPIIILSLLILRNYIITLFYFYCSPLVAIYLTQLYFYRTKFKVQLQSIIMCKSVYISTQYIMVIWLSHVLFCYLA